MCGIVGSFSFGSDAFRLTPEYLIRMRDSMTHRGPDGAGLWISADQKVGLGHRRLSIIDLSAAADQPMTNEDGSLRIVFNGEIYNHAEIRRELESLGGHRWSTDHSDTEVILHAFEQWGIDCLERFRGMFAFALWDQRKRELWLVRDRIGIKPLYYSIHHGRITFASEIKALLKDPEQKREVQEEAFYHYLSFLTTPAPQTLFDGIGKLAGGTWLRVRDDGSVQEHRYWEVWDHTSPMTGVPEAEICERLIAELRTAVQLRKVSDVPVGVFLSGGIDSSTNAALFSEGEGGQVKTFSIGYDTEYKTYRSELPYARQMAEKVGADHHERLLNQRDLMDFLPQMVRLQDEPIADPVCVPVYYVSKLARDNGVIVCQLGEGSDELFCGYPTWKILHRLQTLNHLPVPNFIKHVGLASLRSAGKQDTFPYEMLRRGASGLPVFWGGAESFTESQKQRLISPRLREKFRKYSSWEVVQPIRRRYEEKAWEKSTLNWMGFMDLNMRLPELLLMRVDKMAMGVSLEARVPFLDHKFVELALSIPSSVRYPHGELKYILKKAVRGIIPDELIDRKKQGFGVPVHEWLMQELGDFARSELVEFTRQTDFFDAKEIDTYVDKSYGHRDSVWYLLNFVLWWKEYIAGAAPIPVSAGAGGQACQVSR